MNPDNPARETPWIPDRIRSPERIEELKQLIVARDLKQAELISLIANPLPVDDAVLTDAWLQLEIAQGDLESRVRTTIKGLID